MMKGRTLTPLSALLALVVALTPGLKVPSATASDQVAMALPGSLSFDCSDEDTTQISQAECNALVGFYNATNGPGWKNSAGWLPSAAW